MRVRVVPVAELKRQLLPKGGSVLWLDLPEGTTIADVLRQLDVKVAGPADRRAGRRLRTA